VTSVDKKLDEKMIEEEECEEEEEEEKEEDAIEFSLPAEVSKTGSSRI